MGLTKLRGGWFFRLRIGQGKWHFLHCRGMGGLWCVASVGGRSLDCTGKGIISEGLAFWTLARDLNLETMQLQITDIRHAAVRLPSLWAF